MNRQLYSSGLPPYTYHIVSSCPGASHAATELSASATVPELKVCVEFIADPRLWLH